MGFKSGFLAFCAILSCASQGCAGTKSRGDAPGAHSLRNLYLKSLHVRRPPGPGADPDVGPGGPDYRGTPLPDARLDCRPHETLHASAPLEKLRTCLESVQPGTKISFRLKREPIPELELEETEGAPQCVRELLPRVPAPREIFFQSRAEGELLCYSSRLDIEKDEIRALGVKWPLSRTVLTLVFPVLGPAPEDSGAAREDVRNLLLSWSLAPFFREGSREIEATLVPDRICRVCLGENNVLEPHDPPPPLWPSL